MLQLIMTILMNTPPRVLHILPAEAAESNSHPLPDRLSVSVLSDARNLWLPATVIHEASNDSCLVQVVGGGHYQWALDHIC